MAFQNPTLKLRLRRRGTTAKNQKKRRMKRVLILQSKTRILRRDLRKVPITLRKLLRMRRKMSMATRMIVRTKQARAETRGEQ